ncbi:translesion error-prone DNA polymerase V autoproteolytic subunit [Mucilaginibacter gynuensis]|uniref:Translesion error-prone DNA polymerase V autoproteolytic subunit n=1 Tax=Mucilaginibacter gynuensis TaxID=1302236 RepID=A0ABP8HMZ6_9SPHI
MVVRKYTKGELKRPLAGFWIHAAFESPGTDYEEDRISLDEYVSHHPEATFYVRVTGDCMQYSGIETNDLLVVDRSLTPLPGDIIVAVLNGQHILACYIEFMSKIYLMPDNPKYGPHAVNEFDQLTIEGVVPHTILNQRNHNHVRINRLQQLLCVLRKDLPAGTPG